MKQAEAPKRKVFSEYLDEPCTFWWGLSRLILLPYICAVVIVAGIFWLAGR